MLTALRNFEGTVISGGTRSGIPGLAGEVAETLKQSGECKFKLVGSFEGFMQRDGYGVVWGLARKKPGLIPVGC
ncbi:MAG TPA: hypothetical protein VI136_06950 [Verrucomicrobiae bacterium]